MDPDRSYRSWISVRRTRTRACSFPWGDDIDIWEQATLQRNAIRRANTETALGLIAIAGAVASAAGGHHAAGAIGGTVALGALAGLYGQERTDAVEAAGAAARFPPTHLLALPFRVPPGLFAKRWMLLYTAAQPLGGCIDSFILNYETSDARARPRVAEVQRRLQLQQRRRGGIRMAVEILRPATGRDGGLGP